jgi:cystathionine gamma-lyase
VWLECPTNPLLLVPPIPLIVKILDSLPTRPLLLVDTTFLSSFYFTPLVPTSPDTPPFADVVLSSLTKYSGGHTDIIMGALVASKAAKQRFPELVKGLRFLQNSLGGTASPRDCHLMIRSIKTLPVRMLRHGLNALRLAAWLNGRDDIEHVRYPGLVTDPAFQMVEQLISENAKHELRFLGWSFPFQADTTGEIDRDVESIDQVRKLGIPFGGVINFKVKAASTEQMSRFVSALRLNALAVSLGGVESLLEVPASMTHEVSRRASRISDVQELPDAVKLELGITASLVRVSVGLEEFEDLRSEFERALGELRV